MKSRELRQFLRRVETYGCVPVLANSGHYRIICPDGSLVFCSASPTSGRALREITAELRRHGVPIR